jgi:hypothetical protein
MPKERISRAVNKDTATTMNIPMLKTERAQITQAAAAAAKKAGITRLSDAEWCRSVLFKAAGIKV